MISTTKNGYTLRTVKKTITKAEINGPVTNNPKNDEENNTKRPKLL